MFGCRGGGADVGRLRGWLQLRRRLDQRYLVSRCRDTGFKVRKQHCLASHRINKLSSKYKKGLEPRLYSSRVESTSISDGPRRAGDDADSAGKRIPFDAEPS